MSYVGMLCLSFSLAMDAFAVSLCRGLALKKLKWTDMWTVGLFFGLFQGVMPLLGYGVGQQFGEVVAQAKEYLPTLVLGCLGLGMVVESVKEQEAVEQAEGLPKIPILFALAFATSLDAFAVGLTFVVLEVPILGAISLIAVVTFFFSALGVQIGHVFGQSYEKKAELLGGIMLLLLAFWFYIR